MKTIVARGEFAVGREIQVGSGQLTVGSWQWAGKAKWAVGSGQLAVGEQAFKLSSNRWGRRLR